jgi:hypothetical protein
MVCGMGVHFWLVVYTQMKRPQSLNITFVVISAAVTAYARILITRLFVFLFCEERGCLDCAWIGRVDMGACTCVLFLGWRMADGGSGVLVLASRRCYRVRCLTGPLATTH